MKLTYRHTIAACFVGYIVQAVVNNFVPLLFIMFTTQFDISLDRIAILISVNFGVQLLIDLLSTRFVDKIGYRASVEIAHICAAAGLIGLTFLPDVLPDAFTGLLVSIMIYAIGGGLIEVLISPIVEACPTDNKEAAMSLLHSFYCWGHMGVVILSTIFFALIGIEHWRYLALFWAVIPIANGVVFAKVPIRTLKESTGIELPHKKLFTMPVFYLMLLLMVCAGACEQAVSQWASAFAEKGLSVSKTVGDLAGPMTFALMMGSSRALYAKLSEKIKLERFMLFCGVLCLCSYLLISLSPIPFLSLAGCAVCGFSVGILWPGTFSLATKHIPGGGTFMFALFALAGDLGCGGGPAFVGMMSSKFNDTLQKGILCAITFPILLIVGLTMVKNLHRKQS